MKRIPPAEKPDCPFTLVIDGNVFQCTKKKGLHELHQVEAPIAFRSSRTGFIAVIERSIVWTEKPR